jgi:hypothetical protein
MRFWHAVRIDANKSATKLIRQTIIYYLAKFFYFLLCKFAHNNFAS